MTAALPLRRMKIARPPSVLMTLVLALVIGGGVAVIGQQATPVGWALGIVPALLVLAVGLRRALRRWRVARRSFPERWRAWLDTHVPLYATADAGARRRFERDVQFALDEYAFEGVNGAAVTEARRLAIAAGIAALLHGRPSWELSGTKTVLVYPDRFDDSYYGGTYADYDGMAHEQGPIIVSGPAVDASWSASAEADNVVLHELAHLFDFANEGADGVPSLVDPASASSWQALVRREMQRVERGQSVLRPYAAEAPSEFFAVAVEAFFEQPDALARHHAELYAALVAFFNLDPAGYGADPDDATTSSETPATAT
jgi:hypothetical protein